MRFVRCSGSSSSGEKFLCQEEKRERESVCVCVCVWASERKRHDSVLASLSRNSSGSCPFPRLGLLSVPSARKEAPIPPLQGLLVSGVRSPACRGAFPFGVRRKAPARLRPFHYRIRSPARGGVRASVFCRGTNFAIFLHTKIWKILEIFENLGILNLLRVNLNYFLKYSASFWYHRTSNENPCWVHLLLVYEP
jgi:hypothetical protein